jgi:predicted nucleotidyltransferase
VRTIAEVFSVKDRADLRERLVDDARADGRITAAALVGSGAAAREDSWSDIDLALRVADDADPAEVAEAWTARMYREHGVVQHVDVWSEPTLFRVFLLASSLQVDLSFWPSTAFAARGEGFRLLFGSANPSRPLPAPEPDALAGMGWLYALHARASIARGRPLQGLFMVNGLRDQVVALACMRHGLTPHQARGADDLPEPTAARIGRSIVGSLTGSELRRAFGVAVELLLDEVEQIDPGLARRLRVPADEMLRSAVPPEGEEPTY